MNFDYNVTVDKLLEMNPDPIPKFVLLKEFKGYNKGNSEYDALYEEICNHPFIKKLEKSQNKQGFWHPFHGMSEEVIRLLLSYGLDKNNPILAKALLCLTNFMQGKETTGQHEKQDNPLWYPVMFEPLIFASMISLIDPKNEFIKEQRKIRSHFADVSLSSGVYNENENTKAQLEHFGFKTKNAIPPYNYFNLLLLAPDNENSYINNNSDQSLVDYCINDASFIGYIYNNKLCDFITIDAQNRDSRDFWNWIRALSLVAQFKGWEKYEQKYVDWIMKQRNNDGLWEFPKKFRFALSNSWRGKNKVIDSTIFVLKFLTKKRAF